MKSVSQKLIVPFACCIVAMSLILPLISVFFLARNGIWPTSLDNDIVTVDYNHLLRFLLFSYGITAVIDASVIILLYFQIKNTVTEPINKIRSAAMHLAAYETDYQLEVRTDDEIGDVAEILNGFLRDAIKDLRNKETMIADSMSYAGKIQHNILPSDDIFNQVFKDYNIIWCPREEVGGDLYWMSAHDNGAVLVLCDCTGHGIPGALMTMLVASILTSLVKLHNYQDPSDIMWEMEKRLSVILNINKPESISDIRDGLDILIMFIQKDGSIRLSSANMNLFVCDGQTVNVYKGQRIHIAEGTLKGPEIIKTIDIPANPNNVYYVATDGFFDQVGGEKNIPFGHTRFKNTVLSNHGPDLNMVTDILWSTFSEYKGSQQQRDDITLISFRGLYQ